MSLRSKLERTLGPAKKRTTPNITRFPLPNGQWTSTDYGPSLSVTHTIDSVPGPFTIEQIDNLIRWLCTQFTGNAPEKLIILDLETTGLSGGTGCYPFIIGCACITSSAVTVHQFILPDYPAEPAQLICTSNLITPDTTLITFNGRSFDYPLLTSRYPLHRLSKPQIAHHIDILHPARRIFAQRLCKCNLQTLEKQILSVTRTGDLPSHLVPSVYFDFLRTQNPHLLLPVINHNRTDLISVASLTALIAHYASDPITLELPTADMAGLGQFLYSIGHTRSAIHCLSQASPDHERAARLLVLLLNRSGNHNQAAAICESVINMHDQPWAYIELAKHCEHRLKDITRAHNLTTRALNLAAPSATPDQIEQINHRLNRLNRKLSTTTTFPPLW